MYRSLKSNKYDGTNRINSKPLPGTRCIGTAVKLRRTYFNVVKAVAASGRESDPATQITAVPFP